MGLLDMVLGNSSEVSQQEIDKNFNGVLFDGETVEKGYKVIRDIWLFTSHRLVILDVQGLTGKKKEYLTIPYKSIRQFSVETAGELDNDCEMKLYVAGSSMPYSYEFKKGVDVIGIQRKLAEHICL
ncbi:MAG: PH domain-containing protein [Paludibacteraceae bacterium]|nr:PH domain-containing protein [Paludibacteraceae bacterium]MBR4839438.1 PH domain-containing protein [Paludibacteraceae bacterium]